MEISYPSSGKMNITIPLQSLSKIKSFLVRSGIQKGKRELQIRSLTFYDLREISIVLNKIPWRYGEIKDHNFNLVYKHRPELAKAIAICSYRYRGEIKSLSRFLLKQLSLSELLQLFNEVYKHLEKNDAVSFKKVFDTLSVMSDLIKSKLN